LCKIDAADAKIWQSRLMLDSLDHALLNAVQCDDSRTADQLARVVPLSPSAIARRLRRLRTDGWIQKTIALLSPKLRQRRLQALVFVILSEHANAKGKRSLDARLAAEPAVQFCFDVTGPIDIIVLFDCADMAEFTSLADRVLLADPTVHRYDTHFVRQQTKFAPFVQLGDAT